MSFKDEINFNDSFILLFEQKTFDTTDISPEWDEYRPAWLIPVTISYIIIFITGLLGNICTCIVIARNKSMHTAPNYYLFSLAVSDLSIIIFALLPELIGIWLPKIYIFGKSFCIFQVFISGTSTNATVLTITAFTVERYFAICHPFLSHTMAKLSRIVKSILAVWIISSCSAIPQTKQLYDYEIDSNPGTNLCLLIKTEGIWKHFFEISTFVFFVFPMILITILYVLIAIKLRQSKFISKQKRSENILAAQKKVVKMLVVVVIAFFICWAPYHALRLMVTYFFYKVQYTQAVFNAETALLHISGILYYLSTAVNPVLYNIMSKRFKNAFKTTFVKLCNKKLRSQDGRTKSIEIPTITESLSISTSSDV